MQVTKIAMEPRSWMAVVAHDNKDGAFRVGQPRTTGRPPATGDWHHRNVPLACNRATAEFLALDVHEIRAAGTGLLQLRVRIRAHSTVEPEHSWA